MLKRYGPHIRQFLYRHGNVFHFVVAMLLAYLALGSLLKGRGWRALPRPVEGADINERDVLRSVSPPVAPTPGPGWHLMGTLTSPDGELAVLSHNGREVTVHVGDMIQGWQVSTISMGRVTVRSQNVTRAFELPVPGVLAVNPAFAPSVPYINIVRAVALETLPSIHFQVVPVVGGFRGLEVMPSPNSRPQVLGLAEGDVLEAINGLPVVAGEEVERLHERFARDDSIMLGVRRNSKMVVIHVNLVD